MQNEKAKDLADHDNKAIAHTSIGYAINLVMDYGNGRQVTISGTLPLNASVRDFHRELDKLRVATNRQQALITIRSREANLAAGQKALEMHEYMLKEYERQAQEQLTEIGNRPDKNNTVVKATANNLRAEVENWKRQKQLEINQQRGENEVNEVIIKNATAEVAEIDKLEG